MPELLPPSSGGQVMQINNHPPILVLLPGLDGTGKLFKPFLNALPLNIRTQVIVYPDDRLLTLDDYADWVKERLPPGRIVLLAESFSGPVALTLLSKLGKLLDAVIFSASFAEPPRSLLLRFAPLFAYTGVLLRSMPDFPLRRFCLGMDASTDQIALVRETLAEVSPQILAHRLKLIATPHSFL
jgi:pimeloyl-ACP methyl ester carboxylesterase